MRKSFDNFFARREGLISLHVIFWLSYVSFHFIELMVYQPEQGAGNILGRLSISVWVDVAAAYFTIYYLVFRLVFNKKYIQFTLGLILSATFFVLLQRVVLYYLSYPVFYPEYVDAYGFWRFYPLYSFFNIYSGIALLTSLVFLRNLFISERQKSELEKQSRNGELALLRSQISPHFLFNTLNNIDSLISINPDLASESVIKLSEILRYMLYEANTEKISLRTEMSYLESYIKLQQLRLKRKDFTSLDIKGDLNNVEIAPMLLVPFIENAYKHGNKNVKSPGIEIKLNVLEGSIDFRVMNYVNSNPDVNKDETSGIGLSNVRRRLELIYPLTHELKIHRIEDQHIVNLKIFSSESQMHSSRR